jgi:hypothetical protein
MGTSAIVLVTTIYPTTTLAALTSNPIISRNVEVFTPQKKKLRTIFLKASTIKSFYLKIGCFPFDSAIDGEKGENFRQTVWDKSVVLFGIIVKKTH